MLSALVGSRILLRIFGSATNCHQMLRFRKAARIRTVHDTRQISAAAAVALFSCAAAFGQTAEITGRVLDPSGSVVPGAEITVSSVATAADRVVTTNSSGYYTVPLLLPGEYRVSV